MYKIGRTKNHPSRRILDQQSKNKDGLYKLKESFATNYSIYLEFAIHLYFYQSRVLRTELLDGKTEWFLVTFDEVRDMLSRLKLFLVRMYSDCGSEQDSTYHQNIVNK